MNRRAFVTGVGAMLVAPLTAEAQQGRPVRIGVLSPQTSEATIPFAAALQEGLRAFGYIEGQNTRIDWRYADGLAERFAGLADELVRSKVDIIVAGNQPAVVAAYRATHAIPIVIVAAFDPGDIGVMTVARPGGNVTGFLSQISELVSKRLQLLSEALPQVSRLGVVWDPDYVGSRSMLKELEIGAQRLGLHLDLFETRKPGDFAAAFVRMVRGGAQGVFVLGSSMQYVHQAGIAELALKSHLPSMCVLREYVDAGCLMSYAPSARELWKGSASYVDKILKGAKPGDLPVEQPTKFELVINLKTAKALGLTIPPSLLLRADQIIE